MARAPVSDRLAHMLDAIDAILAHTQGKSFDDYMEQRILRDAVERNIERLSEASRHIPDGAKQRLPGIPWRDVAGIGNVLRHDYPTVDDLAIWNVVVNDLPQLRAAVAALLAELGGA